MRLASHLSSGTEKIESTVTEKLVDGVSKLRSLEHDLHLRAKQFQRRIGMISVAMLVAILGIGVWALSAYKALSETMSPALAALTTGFVLFAIAGLLIYFSQSPKVIRYRLDKRKVRA